MQKPFFRAGYTLLEVIVVILVFIILGEVVFRFFISIGRTQKGLSQQIILQMDSRKALDQVVGRIQEASEVVRPLTGETKPFLVLKDIINQMTLLYLEPNNKVSEDFKKPIYRLMAYTDDYSGSFKKENQRILIEQVKRLTFTSLSPTSVQINATVINEKNEYQFITRVGLMNLGGLDQ